MLRVTLLITALLIQIRFYAQNVGYTISLAPFSTSVNDEYSPVFYNNGIVFCSNLSNSSLVSFKSNQEKLLNIFYVASKGKNRWKSPQLLAPEITTNLNEGPVSFNEKGDTAYFCRNNIIVKAKALSKKNNLGIYSTVKINDKWTDIRPFTYNNPEYSFVTPALSPDGKRLYFASDMPGGFGGADLYYCNRNDSGWDKPINLGSRINTLKNESFPFISKSGKLFFASDGLPGFGGKDIFYSQEINGQWIDPVHLDTLINTSYDDFGFVSNSDLDNGFFSSNRRKTDDIFMFTAAPVIFSACDSMVRDNYCFLFYDEFQTFNDSVPVVYTWDFGDGIKKEGIKVKHCLPGPGNYIVKLIISNRKNGNKLSETPYEFELKETLQVFINSSDVGVVGQPLLFDGLKTNLPNFKIKDYIWDFGEGTITKGAVVTKTFGTKGDYIVRLGLVGQKDSLEGYSKACSTKKIKIFDDYQSLAVSTTKEIHELEEFDSLKNTKDCISEIEKKNKSEKISDLLVVNTYLLDNLSRLQKDKIMKALCGCELGFMDMEKEEIDTVSNSILKDLVNVLRNNPGIKLEVALHATEGSQERSKEITEKWVQSLNSFFYRRGITDKLFHCTGYGSSRTNDKEGSDKSGKRVEFIFLNNNI